MDVTSNDQRWARIISDIQNQIEKAGDSRLLEEIDDFRTLRRENVLVSKERASIVKKNRDSRLTDDELAKFAPERELLNDQEVAIEMIKAVANSILELPAIVSATRNNLNAISGSGENIEVIWLGERLNTQIREENLQQINNLSVGEHTEMAMRVLSIISQGEKEGWQV